MLQSNFPFASPGSGLLSSDEVAAILAISAIIWINYFRKMLDLREP